MAQSVHGTEVLIKSVFALQVAIRSTEGAEAICNKNQLGFTELLKPFSQLSSPGWRISTSRLTGGKAQLSHSKEAGINVDKSPSSRFNFRYTLTSSNVLEKYVPFQLKDMQGHSYSARNVRVRFSEPSSEPVPESKQRMILSDVVQRTVAGKDRKSGAAVQIGKISTLASTPWFDRYRDVSLEHIKQSDHECIRHYVSVVLVVPSTHSAPLEAFSQLYTQQKESEQSKYPKWLTPHLFYYHVLLHDTSEGNDARAQDNFEKVKAAFGSASCYFLQLNSRQPGASTEDIPDPWSQFGSNPTTDNDEVDGNFRHRLSNKLFRRDRKKQEPQRQEPHVPNNEEPPEIIKPNDAREEAKLIMSDSNESLNHEPRSEVPPGNDPLSQLASESPTKSAVISLLDPVRGSRSVGEDQKSGGSSSSVGQCLSLEDHNRLRMFVQEFVGLKLLPHLEAVLKNLNEWVVSRHSMRHSITSMRNRFMKMFSASSQFNSTLSVEANFAYNSLELQTRQLADLAFLLQNFDLAFQTYHSIKKDFQAVSAWLYYAGSVEMCAMSAYLLSSTRREVVTYLEDAISVYNITCKSVHFALRASLLLAEVLRERGLYRELTQLFIKMTSEDADLRSAVCLEQAAHSFLRVHPTMARKYALHLILAGHRYARAVQREHSTRVYKQALEVYQGRGWTLAEDYIHFSLARHSFSLHHLPDAKHAFESLLSHESAQSPNQQLLNLKEFIFVYKQLLNSSHPSVTNQIQLEQQKTVKTCADTVQNLPTLPLPFVRPQLTRVIFATSVSQESLKQPLTHDGVLTGRHRAASGSGSKDSNILAEEGEIVKHSSTGVSITQHLRSLQHSGDSVIGTSDYDPSRLKVPKEQWVSLEKRAASGLRGVAMENFKPSLLVMDHTTDNSNTPFCVINEQIAVGVALKNPLRVPLLMRQLSLVWKFQARSNEADSDPRAASSEVVERVELQPGEQRMVTLRVTPLREGDLEVLGFVYNLCVDTSQQKGSDSPLQPASRPNVPSMAISSRDSLYQKHQGSGVQMNLAEGVQGRVDISICGPRLNNTKVEKASMMYGHDHRLHWIVTAPMPKLVVSMSGLSSWLLSGEMCRIGVEVFNCGQVALNSLRLTSSLPQHLLLEEKSNAEHPIYPSTIVNTTPTSPSLPPAHLHPSHPHPPSPCIEFPLPHSRLEPGEGVGASLVLQGQGGRYSEEEPWNLVFYYEPALITANSRISHRVLRHSCALRVRESLHVRASSVHGQLPAGGGESLGKGGTTPDGFDVNQLIVTVEMENKCQIVDSSAVELRVLQLSCISNKWTVSKMDREQGLLCLLPSESGVVHLKASRATGEQLCFSDVPLGQTVIPSSHFPTSELFFGSDACRALQLKERNSERDKEAPPEEIVLIVFWQALVPSGSDTLFSYGHETLNVPLPQSMAALSEARSSHPPSPYDLVKYYLSHPVSYHHNFSAVSPCQIPVHITLQNCSHTRVQAVLELLHPREGPQETKSSKHPHQESPFLWSGGICRRHIALEADATRTLTVRASFSRPGVYNLNTLRVLVMLEGGSYHLQRWQRTSYITVEE